MSKLDAYSDVSRKVRYCTCECGRPRSKTASACPRCSFLDGTRGHGGIIAALRTCDGLTARELAGYLGVANKEGVIRACVKLVNRGRLRRYWREIETRRAMGRTFGKTLGIITIGGGGGEWVYTLSAESTRDGRAA